MATYVNNLRLKEIATGDESGTWGTSTNTNLELIGEALGFGTEAITTNADTHTTTVADGSSDAGRAMYLKYTGTLDSACTITIGPNTMKRMQFIENGTSGSQNIVISQGSGANVTIPAGDTKAVYLDGAGSGAAVVDAFASLSVVDLKVQDDLTVTDDVSIGGALTLTGNGDFNGDLDVDGTTNLDVVDIDGAVDMASTLQVDGAITSSAGATITVADNSDNLTLTSTDADASVGPNLNLYRNSGSPADDDVTGVIVFNGRNDNSQDVIYARQLSYIKDASDGTEDGQLTLQTMVAGTIRDRLNITPSEISINEDSQDLDFRVESNGNANMLFVDGGNDRVGIGTASPASILHVDEGSDDDAKIIAETHAGGDSMILFSQGASGAGSPTWGIGLDSGSGTSDGLSIGFEDTGYDDFSLTSDSKLVITTAGYVGIGTTSPLFNTNYGNLTLSGTTGGSLFLADDGVQKGMLLGNNDEVRLTANVGYLRFDTGGNNERMRIDSSGNVGIGDTSPDAALNIERSTNYVLTNSGRAENGIHIQSGSAGSGEYGGAISFTCGNLGSAAIAAVNDGGSDNDSVGMAFITHSSSTGAADAAEVARFDENGLFGIGTTSPSQKLHVVGKLKLTDDLIIGGTSPRIDYDGGSTGSLRFFSTSANAERMKIASSGLSDMFSTTSNLRVRTAVDSTNGQLLGGFKNASSTSTGSQVFVVYANGNVQNTNNSYGAISDINLKENIVDATDKLSDIKQVKVRNYNLKGESTKQIGVVAQELETVFPALVETIKDLDADGKQLETETKSVKYSVFVPILIKAMQEQQTLIESLTSRITTLEG